MTTNQLNTMKLPLKHTGKITPENVLHGPAGKFEGLKSQCQKAEKNICFYFAFAPFCQPRHASVLLLTAKTHLETPAAFFCSCWASTVANKNIEINETSPSLCSGINICRPVENSSCKIQPFFPYIAKQKKNRHWYDWFCLVCLFGFYFVCFRATVCFVLFCFTPASKGSCSWEQSCRKSTPELINHWAKKTTQQICPFRILGRPVGVSNVVSWLSWKARGL